MKLHYFQRYHSKENVDTANTMLMLSHLRHHDPDAFFAIINDWLPADAHLSEIDFALQIGKGSSIPDAVISRDSLKLVVETKLYNQFDLDQLMRHLVHFSNEDIKILLTLDPKPMDKSICEEIDDRIESHNAICTVEQKAANENRAKALKQEAFHCSDNEPGYSPIIHINTTFEALIELIEQYHDKDNRILVDIFEDFKDYCLDEGLIPGDTEQNWMRAVSVGTTFDDNITYRLYYSPRARNYPIPGYLGLYTNKSIRAIGQPTKVILASYHNDHFVGTVEYAADESVDTITAEEKKRIINAISAAKKYHYNIGDGEYRYVLVDEFYKTDFKKTSKGGLLSCKNFNLEEYLDSPTLPPIEEIAERLADKTWE